mgnify:CR=1 FL=1
MKRDLTLEKGKPYHIIVRAVEGRTIFPKQEELNRFLVQMYVANYGTPVHLTRRDVTQASKALISGKEIPSFLPAKKDNCLVRIFSFVFVGNHYHLGLVGRFDNAISQYMQRLNTGFAKYFNIKHKRTGSLFGTRFGVVAVTNPRQLAALVDYVNIKNVLDVYRPHWAEAEILPIKKAMKFLYEYPFSSFADVFLTRKCHLVDKDLLQDISEGSFPVHGTNLLERVEDVIRRRGIALSLPAPLE